MPSNSDASLDDAAATLQQAALAYIAKKRRGERARLRDMRRRVHDILFDARHDIPEHIYLQLMNVIGRG